MNLAETYSLSSGFKLNKPYISQSYFPIVPDKYITFQPRSKYTAKDYNYWEDVLQIIIPKLQENNITVVHLGEKESYHFKNTYPTYGQTSIRQVANILSNGLLHFGADSFMGHLAASFDKDVIILTSNNYANNVKPWFGTGKKIIFEPDRKGAKPSFSAEESPKSINTIKAEEIAASILERLNIPNDYPYKTLLVGGHYASKMIECVPDQIIEPREFGVVNIISRMDFTFNEDVLQQQLSKGPCSIITNKPINAELLQVFNKNISEVLYQIEENESIEFVHVLERIGLRYTLLSKLKGKSLNDKKLKFLDHNPIISNAHDKHEILNDITDLHFKSNKLTLSNGKIYPSFESLKQNKSIDNLEGYQKIEESLLTEDFFDELPFFKIIKKVK